MVALVFFLSKRQGCVQPAASGFCFWYGDSRYESWASKSGQACFDNVARVHELRPDKHLIMSEACQEGGPHLGEWSIAERWHRTQDVPSLNLNAYCCLASVCLRTLVLNVVWCRSVLDLKTKPISNKTNT